MVVPTVCGAVCMHGQRTQGDGGGVCRNVIIMPTQDIKIAAVESVLIPEH